jgi:HSP20 family protein
MAPLKRLQLDDLARIQERVNALFEEALLGSGVGPRQERTPGTWEPAVDLLETDAAYLLYAELPGVRREDIELEARERRLELHGTRQPLGEGRTFLRMERSYGPFQRSFELAHPIDAEGIRANFELGILKVEVPKRRPRGRTVPVERGEDG